jgi:hypothetical protein
MRVVSYSRDVPEGEGMRIVGVYTYTLNVGYG